jgi:hypothetical protein
MDAAHRLWAVLGDKGVDPEDIWNMDEIGFRIWMRKDRLIVTNVSGHTTLASRRTGSRLQPLKLYLPAGE